MQVSTAMRPESAVLTVENTGDTLTPQLVSTFTEPLQRGTARTRGDHAGVGLGLAIVDSITRAHDGTLTIVPRPDGGICVTAQLPAGARHPNRVSGDGTLLTHSGSSTEVPIDGSLLMAPGTTNSPSRVDP